MPKGGGGIGGPLLLGGLDGGGVGCSSDDIESLSVHLEAARCLSILDDSAVDLHAAFE